jgi:hypothetical protein
VWVCGIGPGARGDAGKYGLDGRETGCGLTGSWGVYPPLPCWSRPVTRGVYRGSGPPLPAGEKAAAVAGVC